MITLHESNITSFPMDNGIGVLRDVIRAYAEEELNGLFEFYMEYDSEGHLVDELKEERIIKAKAQDKLGYQLFRIYSITKNHDNDNLIIRAQHITYDLADNFVEKLEANNLTKKQVMELIGSSTVLPHPFNITSPNTTTRSSTKLYRTNPLQMVGGIEGSVLQIWGGQIERDNFNLILHDRRGSDDGVKVTYEKNLTGLEATFDISGLVTRIFPFVYIEETDNEPARLITVSGKYIDSPHINDYEKIYIRPIDYTHDERIDIQDKTDAQIRQQLTNIASQYFKETGNDKIKVDMEVQFEHLWETEEYKDLAVLELVGMGDTVTIEHSRLKVNATAIVNYIRYDCIAEKNEEVRLGSVKARLTDNVNRVVDVAEKVEQAQQTANQAIRAANGKNTIYYGPDEPMTGQLGDLWFRVVDGEYTRTYRHDGIQWQLVLSVEVRDAVNEAQQAKDDAQQAVDRANQATQQATNAINQAQSAFDEAQNALSTANNALTQANSAFSLANDAFNEVESLSTIVDENTGEISTIKQSVIGLQTQVSDNAGNISSLTQIAQGLQSQVSDIEGNVSTLTQTVSSLTTRIGDAEGNITALQQTSSSLAARLTDAEGNITTLTATVSGLQTTVTNVQGDVSSVTQLANALQVRMTNAEGNISTLTQTASSLQSTVSSLQSEIDNIDIHILQGGGKQFENLAARSYGTSNVVGALVIKTPITYTYMTRVEIVGYNYQSGANDIDLTVSFYAYTNNTFYHYSYKSVGIRKINKVRLARENGKAVIIIEDVNSTWSYPKIIIKSALIGHGNPPDSYKDGWDIAFETNLSQYTNVINVSGADVQSQITQLSDAINLRVMKGDVINQINISTESILIDGRKVHITGQTTIDNGVIKSAHIQSLDAGKITTGTLDAGKVTLINLVGLDIYGSRFRSETGTDFMEITGGNIRLQQANGRFVEISPSGFYGYNSANDVRFQADSNYVTSAKFGTSNLNVYLGASLGGEIRTVVYETSFGKGGDAREYDYVDIRTLGIKAAPNQHVYLMTDHEIRATSYDKSTYRDIRGNVIYGAGFTTTTTNAYIGTDNVLHVVNKGYVQGSAGNPIYRDIRANDIYNRAIITSTTHAYIGTDGELRVVNKGLTDIYRNVRAAYYYGTVFEFNSVLGGSHIYIRPTSSGEVRITQQGSTSDYRPIRASSFPTASLAEYKQDIKVWEGSALDIINSATIYDYMLNSDVESGKLKRRYGLVVGEGYNTPSEVIDGDGVEQYLMNSISWKAIQELSSVFNKHDDEINYLKLEVQLLRQKIEQLEGMVA